MNVRVAPGRRRHPRLANTFSGALRRTRNIGRLPGTEDPAGQPAMAEAELATELAEPMVAPPETPPTHRVMDLALRVGELLLAGGQSTESVSEAMRSLTVAYGLPRTEAQVTFTGISLSVQPEDAPPITGERLIRRRYPDYARLFAVHKLVEEATLGLLEL
ncbi:MAG: threonine/serine exporter family protein, partial [Micromonosporaceae bacterium]